MTTEQEIIQAVRDYMKTLDENEAFRASVRLVGAVRKASEELPIQLEPKVYKDYVKKIN